MTLMIIVALIVSGLCLGSFINALVYRLRVQELNQPSSKKYSIFTGRSICTHCKHKLAPKDLVPLLSWIWLKGKCRYCRHSISWQYPGVEAITALLFILSYAYWPSEISGIGTLVFIVWLIILTGLLALAVYDIRWMILPNKIIFPLYALATSDLALRYIETGDKSVIISSFWGAVIGGGIFYVLFQISGGKWIGGGDVKLGFLLGLIAGGTLEAFLLLFIASLLGSLFSVPIIVRDKLGGKAKIAFGPFLIIAAIIVVLFGQSIIDAYNKLLMI